MAVDPAPHTASVPRKRGGWRDLLAMAILAVVTGACVYLTMARADPRFLILPTGNDVWFEADLPTVTDRMLHRSSNQGRNARHPLFPLMAAVPVYAFRTLGLSESSALRTVFVAIAMAWSAALFLLLRIVTTRRGDAILFTVLGHVTAAATFWLPVPETYALGSVSVMVPLALCLWDTDARHGARWYTAAAAFSLSITTSNWLTGLAAIGTRHSWSRALRIAAASLAAVLLLWGVQRLAFPTVPFFIGETGQSRFILPHGVAGIPQSLRAALFHSIVMPAIHVVPEPKWGPIMSVQASGLLSSGAWGGAATFAWGALFALGLLALGGSDNAVRLPLALALAGHLLVYGVYGEETFLYTAHLAPILVAIAALATRTRARPVALGLAATLIVLLAANNWSALGRALAFFETAGK